MNVIAPTTQMVENRLILYEFFVALFQNKNKKDKTRPKPNPVK
jgi:hypothetical protein